MLRPQRVSGYDLRLLRHSKKIGRRRRRFCDKFGHGNWMFTCGSTSLDGHIVQSDSGWICGLCGFYLACRTPNLKVA